MATSPIGGSSLASPAAAVPAERRALQVLLVEGDERSRRFVQSALEEARRFTPTLSVAPSLEAAEAALAAQRPHCAILGVRPLDVDGVGAVRRLLAAAPGLPLLVLVDSATPGAADPLIQAGAQDVLDEGTLDPRTLERSVRYAIDRGAWAGELAAKNAQLEQQNRDLDDFAHVAGHDLKAPLRAVNYLVQDAKRAIAASDSAAAAQWLGEAEKRVRRLFNMIDGLLASARVGRRAGAAAGPPFDPMEALREALDRLDVPAGFQLSIPTAALPVTGSRADLAQVFQNLVANALQHHDRGHGSIALSCQPAGRLLEFQVEDDGPGIPQQAVASVFKPFATGGAPTGGAGIGLAQARKVIEANGGAIWLASAGRRGACFHFTWPLAEAQPA